MTQQEKDKLLKYLCMALPYGVKVELKANNCYDSICKLNAFDLYSFIKNRPRSEEWCDTITSIKPYLRPMSSMTQEEYKSILHLLGERRVTYKANGGFELNKIKTCSLELIDWLLEHHFDFMGLIPIDLAIEITNENNPYKD